MENINLPINVLILFCGWENEGTFKYLFTFHVSSHNFGRRLPQVPSNMDLQN